MKLARLRPAKKQDAATWKEVLLSEVLPGVDAAGGRRLRGGEGLIYFNARYYDPTTGRFLTEDPSRKGVNWYAYCENDPINKTDPDGKDVGQNLIDVGSALQVLHSDYAARVAGDPQLFQLRKTESAALSALPVLGGVKDIVEGFAGKEFLTGERLSGIQRAVAVASGVAGLIPWAGVVANKLLIQPEAAYLGKVLTTGQQSVAPLALKPSVAQAASNLRGASQTVDIARQALESQEALRFGASLAAEGHK
jgi:RHS repeat-associated protein